MHLGLDWALVSSGVPVPKQPAAPPPEAPAERPAPAPKARPSLLRRVVRRTLKTIFWTGVTLLGFVLAVVVWILFFFPPPQKFTAPSRRRLERGQRL